MSGPDIPDLAMAMPIAGIQAGTNSFTLIFHHRCISASNSVLPFFASQAERIQQLSHANSFKDVSTLLP